MKRWGRASRRRYEPIPAAPRVVIVGHCAAGKSTLVEGLRRDGIDAVLRGESPPNRLA